MTEAKQTRTAAGAIAEQFDHDRYRMEHPQTGERIEDILSRESVFFTNMVRYEFEDDSGIVVSDNSSWTLVDKIDCTG